MSTEENSQNTEKWNNKSIQSPTFTIKIEDICAVMKADEGETENSSQKCSKLNLHG